jgi:Rod binding domain-containing protein
MGVSGIDIATRLLSGADHDTGRLRETVDELLGSVFFGTLLKAMRESGLKGPYGHGGRGEEVFAAQLHGMLAERMGIAADIGIGDMLYERLEKQQRCISTHRADL